MEPLLVEQVSVLLYICCSRKRSIVSQFVLLQLINHEIDCILVKKRKTTPNYLRCHLYVSLVSGPNIKTSSVVLVLCFIASTTKRNRVGGFYFVNKKKNTKLFSI